MNSNYEYIQQSAPIILSINLYKYNYYDNLLISHLRNNYILYKNEKNLIILSSYKLMTALSIEFKDYLNYTSSYPLDRLSHSINTFFQIFTLLKYYMNVKLVEINISYDKNYSKVVKNDTGEMIALDYKINKIILRYDKFFDNSEINLLNALLKEIKIISSIKPESSYNINLLDYLYMVKDNKNSKFDKIKNFNDKVFTEKFKIDNPIINLITDF